MKIKNLAILSAFLMASLFIFNACSDDEAVVEENSEELELFTDNSLNEAEILSELSTENSSDLKCGGGHYEICGDFKFYPLIASKKYYVGALIVYNDKDNLYVTYYGSGWLRFSEFHLFVGEDNELPVTKSGNPKIGHFPYKAESSYGFKYKTFVIPLNKVPDCYTLAAHAVVRGHTVWAGSCKTFNGHRWGWKIEDCVEKCEEELEPKVFTAKFRIRNDEQTEERIGSLNDGTPSYDGSWCRLLSVVSGDESATYNMVDLNEEVIGTLVLDVKDGSTDVSITTIEGWKITDSYVFYGTEEEYGVYFDEGVLCPKYREFPYITVQMLDEHTYSFPAE